MKVYMQYPLGISDSQYYKSMIDNHPENIEYINTLKGIGMIHNKRKFLLLNLLKNIVRTLTNKLGLIIPNAHTSPVGDYDIIHCGHCLSKNKNKPNVIDVESLWQLWISGCDEREKVLEYLKRDNCKRIIAWTESTKQDIIEKFPEVKNKVEVIYYAMKYPKETKKNDKEITLFFSGRHFYSKGGLHATEAMDRLTKKYSNVKGIINGVIPKEIKEKYSKNKKLKFYGLMPHKKVLKLYEAADIFVYPGYSDSFGFVFIEAMAYGIPTVTVDGYARKEIIKEDRTGFVLDRPIILNIKDIEETIIDDIVKKTSSLIENEELLNNMSEECRLEVKQGRFSIQERNKRLSKVYKKITIKK